MDNRWKLEEARNATERQIIKNKFRVDEERLNDLMPKSNSPSYFDLYHDIIRFYAETEEFCNFKNYMENMECAKNVFVSLYKNLDELDCCIEDEEEYIKTKDKREGVLGEIESQCCKLYKDYYKPADGFPDLHGVTKEFVVNLIENRLIKCTVRLSGDDSGLNNFWEELCVQVQQEHSIFWGAYLEDLSRWIDEELEKLPKWKLNAIWLDVLKKKYIAITEDEFDYLDAIDREKINVTKDSYGCLNEINEYITDEIMKIAVDYSNDAIENYIEGSYEHD